MIDDGSTDKTGEIVDAYRENPKIDIIHQENKGFSGARNAGIQVIDSEYIMFVDSDDILADGAIDTLLTLAMKNNIAIVEGGYETINERGKKRKLIRKKSGELNVFNELRGFPWGKVYNRKYFEFLDFPEGFWYEDSILRQVVYPLIFMNGDIAYGIDVPVYKYRKRKQSISHAGKKQTKSIDTLWITLELSKVREELEIPYAATYYEHILSMIRLSNSRTKLMPQAARRALFTVYADFLDKKMPDFKTNVRSKELLECSLRTKSFSLYKLACEIWE